MTGWIGARDDCETHHVNGRGCADEREGLLRGAIDMAALRAWWREHCVRLAATASMEMLIFGQLRGYSVKHTRYSQGHHPGHSQGGFPFLRFLFIASTWRSQTTSVMNLGSLSAPTAMIPRFRGHDSLETVEPSALSLAPFREVQPVPVQSRLLQRQEGTQISGSDPDLQLTCSPVRSPVIFPRYIITRVCHCILEIRDEASSDPRISSFATRSPASSPS